jgi:type IV secretion system protein VirB10
MSSTQDSTSKTEEKASAIDQGIVSVNRHTRETNQTARLAVLIVMAIVVVLGLVFTANTLNAKRKAETTKEEQAAKVENKPAQVGLRRVFEADPLPPPKTAMLTSANKANISTHHGIPHQIDNSADMSRSMALGPASERSNAPSLSRPSSSRFGGEVLLTNNTSGTNVPRTTQAATGPEAAISLVRELLAGTRQADGMDQSFMPNGSGASTPAGAMTVADSSSAAPLSVGYGATGTPTIGITGVGLPAPPGPAASGTGSIGGLLTPSDTPKVQAGLLGDRNLILPKGRAIDCALTVRVINEVAGMATCVLNSDVYSDNGRVVLLERGSEAVGEYAATMAQGQRRLFLLWTRVKTPTGVVINLNSPAADALGTSGLVGYVDNHWWDRLGAAFMLSLVQDGIGLATAAQANASGAQSLGIYQHSATTGNRMAELILQSTINIKPTLYKNQGDRGTIFVARDLDFSTVYELQPH